MTILKPDVPGTVIRFVGQTTQHIPPSAAETVAIPIVADWGPIVTDAPGSDGRSGGVQEVESFAEYTAVFGASDTPGRTAVAGAFAGEGLPGSAGAGAVLAGRMAHSDAAAASVVINETGGSTPGVTLTGKYKGTRGNRISYILDTDPSNVLRDRLRILLDGAVQESYVYLQTDVATLVSSINNRSKLVKAVNDESSPTRLTASAGASLTGGNDGADVASADHLATLDALESKSFGILAPYDLTDAGILASYVSWVQAKEEANRPVRLVVGGAAGESIDDALTRSAACADPHVINFGVGTYHDDLLDKDLSTSQLAPRIAGILAAKGEEHALTYAKIAGLHAVGDTAPATDAIESAVIGGVVVVQQAFANDADLRITKGVTTFTSSTVAGRPLDVFGDARLVGVMDNYIRNMKQWGDDIVIGDLPVNDDTRSLVRGQARKLQDALLRRGLILPGNAAAQPPIPAPFVVVADPGDPSLLDAIPYSFGWQFAFTANAILGEGTIS